MMKFIKSNWKEMLIVLLIALAANLYTKANNAMDAAIASRTSVGAIGLATALYVGLLWMQRLRAALRQMWGQQFPPPGFLNTKMSDVIALVAAFLASLLTIGFSALATSALRLAGSVRLGSLLVSILVAWLLFTVMIARLPHDPVSLRRCAGAGLLAAVGFEVFKQVGSIYLQTVLHGPAGAVFGPVLGLMVFAYMTARLVLFATAWAAECSEETALPGSVVVGP